MMNARTIAPEEMRLRLAQTMALVASRRPAILAAIQTLLAERAHQADRSGAAWIAAMLFDLLLDGASDIAAFGALRDLSPVAHAHQRLGLSRTTYHAFGTGVGPALRKVLGDSVGQESASAWSDAYWLILGRIAPGETPGAKRSGGLPLMGRIRFSPETT